jgi:hypothetical protein
MNNVKSGMSEEYTTVGNRASVCNSTLTVEFLTHEQCKRFISAMMETEAFNTTNFQFDTVKDDNETKYTVSVYEIIWANNLSILGKLLESVDFKMDDPEEMSEESEIDVTIPLAVASAREHANRISDTLSAIHINKLCHIIDDLRNKS